VENRERRWVSAGAVRRGRNSSGGKVSLFDGHQIPEGMGIGREGVVLRRQGI